MACLSPYTILPQPNGPHSFEVRAQDVTSPNLIDLSPAKVVFTVEPPAPPPPPTGPGPSGPPALGPIGSPAPGPSGPGGPAAGSDITPPVVSLIVERRQTVPSLLARGLRLRLTSGEAAAISTRLSVGTRTLGRLSSRLAASGTARLAVRLTRAQQRWLNRGASLTATLRVTVTDAAGNTTQLKRTVRLVRAHQ